MLTCAKNIVANLELAAADADDRLDPRYWLRAAERDATALLAELRDALHRLRTEDEVVDIRND